MTRLLTFYILTAFIEFLFLVAIIKFINRIKKKYPEANMPETDLTSHELFCFSIAWPLYVGRVFFRRILKPLLKKGA